MRNTNHWKNIFKLLKNEKYACKLIDVVIFMNNKIKLSKDECQHVHDTYDQRILYQALGYAIKGSDTETVKIFADIIYKYWNILDVYLNIEVRELINN